MAAEDNDGQLVIIGQISGIHGIRGGLKLFSYTDPRDRIFSYTPWWLKLDTGWSEYKPVQGRPAGKALTVFLEGIDDRDAARLLLGSEIAVAREKFPALSKGEYYWCDLVNLEVLDTRGVKLGILKELQETGANDVMVVEGNGQLLIPWVIDEIVKQVDLQSGMIIVDWDPGFQ